MGLPLIPGEPRLGCENSVLRFRRPVDLQGSDGDDTDAEAGLAEGLDFIEYLVDQNETWDYISTKLVQRLVSRVSHDFYSHWERR